MSARVAVILLVYGLLIVGVVVWEALTDECAGARDGHGTTETESTAW